MALAAPARVSDSTNRGLSSPKPSFPSIAQDGFAIVEIGLQRKKFYIHKALLQYHSRYFRRALKGPWKEGDEVKVAIPELDSGLFDVFVRWLYTEKVLWDLADLGHAEVLRDIYPLGTHPDDNEDDDRYVTVLVKAYMLENRIFARGFRNAVMTRLIEHINANPAPNWVYATAHAFNNLPESCVMLKALVDIHCRYWSEDLNGDIDGKISDRIPTAFWKEIMKTYAKRVRRTEDDKHGDWWQRELYPCDYHEHFKPSEERE